jgi:magnesium-transporting ATPase (P-type)
MFLRELVGFFQLLLWIGCLLSFIGFGIQPDKTDKSNIYLGVVIAGIVIVIACFSYSQSSKAASLMADFKNFIPREALVTREGVQSRLESRLLVPGDIIQINAGDNIPADVVLFNASEMKVNNASLTGESEDLLRKVEVKTTNIFESPNVAFFGTMCTLGSGTGVVIRTGDETVIGRIANLSQSAETKKTPLALEMDRFVYMIAGLAIFMGVFFFIYGLFYFGAISSLLFAIGIVVANVPEGLLATVAISLALTAKRLAVKMVLVKNLESVETLGSTTCICSDKTGTLTQNRMTVSSVFIDRKITSATVNWGTYKEMIMKEKEKAEKSGEEPKNIEGPKYEIDDPSF